MSIFIWKDLQITTASGITPYKIIDGQILSFRTLDHGWHYGEGSCATEIAIDMALKIHARLIAHGATEIEVFPSVDGGVLVSGYHENHAVEVLCHHDGKTDMLHERNEAVIHESNDVTLDAIDTYLGALQWRQEKSFDFFTLNTTAEKNKDLAAWLSKTHPMVEYLSLMRSVQEQPVEPNAPTFFVFTLQRHQENLLFFGKSISPNYREELYPNTNHLLPETTAT